jgi:hypothetical protein
LSQKIAQKLPEKKMPSTAAKATKRSANEFDAVQIRINTNKVA